MEINDKHIPINTFTENHYRVIINEELDKRNIKKYKAIKCDYCNNITNLYNHSCEHCGAPIYDK